MAAQSEPSRSRNSGDDDQQRFALRERDADKRADGSDGAWWPATRSLTDELPGLLELWPIQQWGRIARVLYSPPDWDDHPRAIPVGDRRVKAGSFPRDDTHRLVVTTSDRARHILTVVAPASTPAEARPVLDGHALDPR